MENQVESCMTKATVIGTFSKWSTTALAGISSCTVESQYSEPAQVQLSLFCESLGIEWWLSLVRGGVSCLCFSETPALELKSAMIIPVWTWTMYLCMVTKSLESGINSWSSNLGSCNYLCVTMRNLLFLCVLEFPELHQFDNSAYFTRLLRIDWITICQMLRSDDVYYHEQLEKEISGPFRFYYGRQAQHPIKTQKMGKFPNHMMAGIKEWPMSII